MSIVLFSFWQAPHLSEGVSLPAVMKVSFRYVAAIALVVTLVALVPQVTDARLTGPRLRSNAGDPPKFDVYYQEQPIDHFNSQVKGTFKQRYLVTKAFWKPDPKTGFSGPVFVYTGGESNVEWFWRSAGNVFAMAKKYGALVVFAEHRYYGESMPFGTAKDSLTKENIGYLSAIQALSDCSVVINTVLNQFDVMDETPIIAIGGSYSGMLAAWLRIRYAHIVDAAVSSSAPLYMAGQGYPNKLVTDSSFFARVTSDYQDANIKCPGIVRYGYTQLLNSFAASAFAKVQNDFKLCKTPTKNDLQEIVLWTRQALLSMAQVNYAYPVSAESYKNNHYSSNTSTGAAPGLPAWPVSVACEGMISVMSGGKGDALQALASATHLYYDSLHGPQSCYEPTKDFGFCADQTGCGDGDEGIAWDYQACTEMIYFPSTNNQTDMFPAVSWTPAKATDYCQKKWGVTPKLDMLANEFGSRDIGYSSNIIFTNGHIDPWSTGGVQFSLSPTLVALSCEECAHHADLNTPHEADPETVRVQRRETEKFLETVILNSTMTARKLFKQREAEFVAVQNQLRTESEARRASNLARIERLRHKKHNHWHDHA